MLRCTETHPQVSWQRVKLQIAYWHKHWCTLQLFPLFHPHYPACLCLSVSNSAYSWGRKCVCVCETGRIDSRELPQMSNSSWRLLMSQLTAGSSEVIKMSDGGAKRTNRGGGGHHLLQPVSFILAPALMKSAYWDWRMCDEWQSGAWDLTLYQTSRSEWAVTWVHDICDLQAPVLPHRTFSRLQ